MNWALARTAPNDPGCLGWKGEGAANVSRTLMYAVCPPGMCLHGVHMLTQVLLTSVGSVDMG